MMNYGNMMSSGFGIFALLTWLLVIVNLVLLAVWLWKQIQKN